MKPKADPTQGLRIVDAMPETGRTQPGIYTPLFNQLKPGQAIECDIKDTQKIRLALHKWMQRKSLLDTHYPKTREIKETGRGYVAIAPRSELANHPSQRVKK